MDHLGEDERKKIPFKESDSFNEDRLVHDESLVDNPKTPRDQPYSGLNRFKEKRIRFKSVKETPEKTNISNIFSENTFEDELGMRHPLADTETSQSKILQEVRKKLSSNPCLEGSHIEVDLQGKILVLRGTVSSWSEKKLAQNIIEDLWNAKKIHNQLLVRHEKIQGWVPGISKLFKKDSGD